METTTPTPLAVNTKDESFFKELGARIALARKGKQPHPGAAGHHEDLLGQPSQANARAKRGPLPALARRMERISALPRPQQKFVIRVIEMALAQQAARR